MVKRNCGPYCFSWIHWSLHSVQWNCRFLSFPPCQGAGGLRGCCPLYLGPEQKLRAHLHLCWQDTSKNPFSAPSLHGGFLAPLVKRLLPPFLSLSIILPLAFPFFFLLFLLPLASNTLFFKYLLVFIQFTPPYFFPSVLFPSFSSNLLLIFFLLYLSFPLLFSPISLCFTSLPIILLPTRLFLNAIETKERV